MARTFDEVQALNGQRTKVRLTVEIDFFVHPGAADLRDALFLTAPDVAKKLLPPVLNQLIAEGCRQAVPSAIMLAALQGRLEPPPEEQMQLVACFHMANEVLTATEEEYLAAHEGIESVFKLKADGSDEVVPVMRAEGDVRSEPIEQ